MTSNNPVYTLRLIDLVDMNKLDFSYEDLYKKVGEWLESEKQFFVVEDNVMWERFLQSFCDRFYSRNLNFNTYLDFKIKLRDVLRRCKSQATRIYESDLLEIKPLETFRTETERTDQSQGESHNANKNSTENTSSSSGTSHTENENSNKDESQNVQDDSRKSYDLHSDTPSNAVNIANLFNESKNYVTDANNHKSEGQTTVKTTNNGTNKGSVNSDNSTTGKSNTESSGEGSSDFSNSSIFNEISKGYSGNQVELIKQYMELVTDVVQFYLDEIENACLFSNVLY